MTAFRQVSTRLFDRQVVLLSEEVEELREKNSGFESALEKAIEESKVEIQSLVESVSYLFLLSTKNQRLKVLRKSRITIVFVQYVYFKLVLK